MNRGLPFVAARTLPSKLRASVRILPRQTRAPPLGGDVYHYLQSEWSVQSALRAPRAVGDVERPSLPAMASLALPFEGRPHSQVLSRHKAPATIARNSFKFGNASSCAGRAPLADADPV